MKNDIYCISLKLKELEKLLGQEVGIDFVENGLHIPGTENNGYGYWILCDDSESLYNTIQDMINGINAYKHCKGIK